MKMKCEHSFGKSYIMQRQLPWQEFRNLSHIVMLYLRKKICDNVMLDA